MNRIFTGECREVMKRLIADGVRVNVVVTSPPYWALRAYNTLPVTWADGWVGELGLEPSVFQYIAHMVEVFDLVRELMHDDAVCFLNIGDTYITRPNGGIGHNSKINGQGSQIASREASAVVSRQRNRGPLKLKDMALVPQRLAVALQNSGWWVRQDIIWNKPNPMPGSYQDRFTTAHEYLWLLARGQWSERSIEFLDMPEERVHFGKDLWAHDADMGPVGLCVRMATAIYDGAQRQKDFGLPPFYAQEWKQLARGGDGDLASSLPAEHRLTAYAARFLCGDTTAKDFLGQIDGLRSDLADAKYFLVGGRSTKDALAPTIYADGECAIAIHDAGQICKIDFAHQRIVLRSPRDCYYYFDDEAVKEPSSPNSHARMARAHGGYHAPGQDEHKGVLAPRGNAGVNPKARSRKPAGWATDGSHRDLAGRYPVPKQNDSFSAAVVDLVGMRRKRDVWTIPTTPYSGSHYATFPEALVEPCILAGTSARGHCPRCGSGWRRVMGEPLPAAYGISSGNKERKDRSEHGGVPPAGAESIGHQNQAFGVPWQPQIPVTIGWEPTCKCHERVKCEDACVLEPIPGVAFDPFMGTGTVAKVATRLGRQYLGCDLDTKNETLQRERLDGMTTGLALA